MRTSKPAVGSDGSQPLVSARPTTIRFMRPSSTVPVSLTGPQCALQCAHCGGRYLEHMQPIWDVRLDNAKSCLISGGCDMHGRVPVTEHLGTVATLKDGRRLNWHVGFVDQNDLDEITPYVDVISFDVVGDAATAREVYGLDVGLDDYIDTLRLLMGAAPVVPHITIGLYAGQIRGEYAALEAMRSLNVSRLILIVFIPTARTRYADCAPPALGEVGDLLTYARQILPDTALYLGCMRPHGRYRQTLDTLAVESGLNGIVNPTRAAEKAASTAGLTVVWGDECCALY